MTESAEQVRRVRVCARRRSSRLLMATLCGAVAVWSYSDPVVAQATGRNAVVAGIKSYEDGRADKAVSALTAAITKGGLSPQDLAKAFHYRGLAYRKQKQPALAIADLTNAVWLKDGLSDTERAAALEARASAYREAGLQDPGPPPGMPGPAVAAAAGQSSKAGSAGATAASGNWLALSGSGDGTAQSSGSGNPLSGVGSFFSGMFGGNGSSASRGEAASAAPAAAAPIETASTGTSATTAVSAWTRATDVAAAQPAPARPSRTAAAAASAPALGAKGKYQVQVAALRTRAEAEKLAGELSARHGDQLGSRATSIDETVFGTMGTFYRVSVGPFASTGETDKACRAFKASGYDCLIVGK